jgi:DNA-directed RNA polymerase subunit H (RpoH/RPB5)
MTCTNKTLKSLGTLQGVFGAEIDQVNAVVTVEHTDEISRMEISEILQTLGYPEIKGDELPEINYDDPSIWGCAL